MNFDDDSYTAVESPDGGTGITCRVSASSGGRTLKRVISLECAPGSVCRVSISFGGSGKAASVSTRAIAYIDATTGKGIVRMGSVRPKRGSGGIEDGPQLVVETETPVWKGKT